MKEKFMTPNRRLQIKRLSIGVGLVALATVACQSTTPSGYPPVGTPAPAVVPVDKPSAAVVDPYTAWQPPPKVAGISGGYIERQEVQQFVNDFAKKYRWNANEVYNILAPVQPDSSIIKAVLPLPKGGAKNWRVYRSRFVEPVRIRAAKEFIEQYHSELKLAEQTYGVPAEIIASIIGVETIYGRNMGDYQVLDALTNLAFDYPMAHNRVQRVELFKSELENFLLLSKEQRKPISSYVGSYAGAIGFPQFMPSSIRKYAVDFDKDGVIDLSGSAVDAIGSVGNFLKQHGWESGRPIEWRMTNDEANRHLMEEVADGEALPKIPLGRLLDAGLTLDDAVHAPAERNTQVLIIDLPTPNQATQYRIGLKNFYVITRYNRSFFYAQSVYDLAEEIRQYF